MEARNQSYRDRADKFAARPAISNKYIEETANLTNAIALRTQIEKPTDEDKRKISNHYRSLFALSAGLSYASTETLVKYLHGAIHYRKHIKIKTPTDRTALADFYAILANICGNDNRYGLIKRNKNYASAISVLVEYCKEYPKDHASKRELAKIYAAIDDYKSAVAELEKIPGDVKDTKDVVTLSKYYIEVAHHETAGPGSATKRLAAYSKAIDLLMPLSESADKDVADTLNKAAKAKLDCIAAINEENRKAKAAKRETPGSDSSSSDSESSLRKNSVFAKPAATPVPAPEWKDKNEKTRNPKSR